MMIKNYVFLHCVIKVLISSFSFCTTCSQNSIDKKVVIRKMSNQQNYCQLSTPTWRGGGDGTIINFFFVFFLRYVQGRYNRRGRGLNLEVPLDQVTPARFSPVFTGGRFLELFLEGRSHIQMDIKV